MTINPNSTNDLSSGDLLNIPALINGIDIRDQFRTGGDADCSEGQLVTKQMLIGTVKALVEYFDERINSALGNSAHLDNPTNLL